MDLTTIIGLVAGTILIVVSILISEGASLSSFLDWPSVLIVFGGTFASSIITIPMKDMRTLLPVILSAFKVPKTESLYAEIDRIADMAVIAKKNGMLYLENALAEIDDPFLKKGLMLVMDGTDPEYVRELLETDIHYMQERHSKGQSFIDTMSSFAPAYGMIGTLVGLINMLKNLSDADALAPSMAVALVTTFYGVVLANLIFTPISKKLKVNSAQETLRKEVLLEGILAIQVGENPRLIKERLYCFLSNSDTRRYGIAAEGAREVIDGPSQ